MMGVSINLKTVIIIQYMHVLNHHNTHLKLTECSMSLVSQ